MVKRSQPGARGHLLEHPRPRHDLRPQPSTAIPLPSMKIPVDSPLVMKNSRHAITEAGLDTIVENLRRLANSRGQHGAGTGSAHLQGDRKSSRARPTVPPFRAPDGGGRNLERLSRRAVDASATGRGPGFAGQLIERYVYREIRENPDASGGGRCL